MRVKTRGWLLATATISGACLLEVAAETPTVLVATDSTAFKRALVREIDTLLRKRRVRGKLATLKDLPEVSPDNYAAIVIIGTIFEWQPKGATIAFLKRIERSDRRKVVLVTTANSNSWRAPGKGLHAISSASQINRVPKVIAEIEEALDAITRSGDP